jgi:hypothetical protein
MNQPTRVGEHTMRQEAKIKRNGADGIDAVDFLGILREVGT